MRVLVVDEEVPWPLDNGKKIRTFNLLRRLSSAHEITYLCRFHEGSEQTTEGEASRALGCRVRRIEDPIRRKSGVKFYAALIRSISSRLPYVVTSHASRKMALEVRRLLPGNDLLHCEWTPYFQNIEASLPFPSVAVAHNVESDVWRRLFAVERRPLRKLVFFLEWKKMERFEKRAFPRFSRVAAVSGGDRDRISRWMPAERISVVENGVDLDRYRPGGTVRGDRVLFVGSLDWSANIDAVDHFLDAIWPRIRCSVPGAQFVTVGRNPSPELAHRIQKNPGASVHGSVPDIRPFLEEAAVIVVPLRVGGGSRLKILEAFASGKAVVSTAVGVEGIEAVDGQHLLVADDPAGFAGAVERLLREPSLRERIGAAGRQLVEARYGWKALSVKLDTLWTEALGEKLATSSDR
jgi:glycosyltransferase involved in cell wall biosynthesis